jgi:SAM-dependent methyltransferase
MNQQAIWNTRYAGGANPEQDGWLDQYEPYLNEEKSRTIVDLGCGRGQYARLLAEQGYRVVACDFSSVATQFVRETCPGVETRCFDMITDFPEDITNAGVVIASLSTHYFPMGDTVKLYRKIRDMLEPGGIFILRVNSKQELERNDRSHVQHQIEEDYYQVDDGTNKRYFDADSLSALLDGFVVERISESSSVYHGRVKYYVECVARKR